MTKLRGVLVLCFSYFRDNSNVLETYLKTYFQGPTPSLEVKTHYIRHSMSLQFLVNPRLESMGSDLFVHLSCQMISFIPFLQSAEIQNVPPMPHKL
jgi:hypothetical protein